MQVQIKMMKIKAKLSLFCFLQYQVGFCLSLIVCW